LIGVVEVPVCDHSFLDCLGGNFNLSSSETEDQVMACVPSVLSKFAGHGKQSFVVVACCFGI
jgi:hypothetical protein